METHTLKDAWKDYRTSFTYQGKTYESDGTGLTTSITVD
jgi:hypothetical protein